MKVHQYLIGIGAVVLTTGCASYQIAQDVKLLSFTGEPKAKEVSQGQVEGKSCQWSVLGYALGEAPTLRTAFNNATKGQDGGAIPFTKAADAHGSQLSIIRNVSTETSGMSLYLVGRRCLVVAGLGAQ